MEYGLLIILVLDVILFIYTIINSEFTILLQN